MTIPTLYVRNIEQAALWLELDGQISDGAWENASPRNHWTVWCDARVVVSPKNVGRNFYARKDNYNFTSDELLEVVERRMLALVRIARRFGIKVASLLEHAPDCETGLIDVNASWNDDRIDEAAKLAGLDRVEFVEELCKALFDESYTTRQLLADLRDLKVIVKTRRD